MAGAAPQKQYVPLNQAAQGGLIDDIDATITDALWTEYDYNGKIDHSILALGIQFTDDNGKTYDQYYACGELTFFVPTDDGAGIVPVADKQMINDNTNAWKFFASLIEVGVPDEMLAAGNVKAFVGMKLHVKQHAQPKRQGLIRGATQGDREPTVLLASALLAMPGQNAPAKPAGKVPGTRPTQAATKPGLGKTTAATTSKPSSGATARTSNKANGQAGASTPAAAATDDGLKETALEILTEILMENEGTVVKKSLSQLSFQKAGERVSAGTLDSKQKTKVCQLIFQDSVLHSWAEAGAIVYDGAQVSLPA